MKTVIYKVGGSLLSLGDLSARIQNILAQRPQTRPLLIVGGGPTANLVREWDQLHNLGEECSHWLALRSLQLNESLMAEIIPDADIVTSRQEADTAWSTGRLPILSAFAFLKDEEKFNESQLPHCWDVTSDSIAAWITHRWPAEELILLKSSILPLGYDIEQAAHDRFVDPHFPKIASELPCISWVNLREDHPEIQTWLRLNRVPLLASYRVPLYAAN